MIVSCLLISHCPYSAQHSQMLNTHSWNCIAVLLKKNTLYGVPSWLSAQKIQLESMRMKVGSLDSLSRLKTQCCHVLWCRSQTQLRPRIALAVAQASSCSPNSTPALELPYASGVALKSKKQTKKQTKILFTRPFFFLPSPVEYKQNESSYFSLLLMPLTQALGN